MSQYCTPRTFDANVLSIFDPHFLIFWQVIDCSFGIIGILPLMLCRHYIKHFEKLDNADRGV